MPILSVKRIPQLMTSQARFQTFGPVPQSPLSSLGLLCLSSVSPPCCIVSRCQGFVWKSKPANAREQRYFVDLEGLFVCHHQEKGRFCWLSLWRLRDDDSRITFIDLSCCFSPLSNFLCVRNKGLSEVRLIMVSHAFIASEWRQKFSFTLRALLAHSITQRQFTGVWCYLNAS